MQSNPVISIIVPVYKVEPYISTCVDSILSQKYTNWKLILVDDGSPDNCPSICDKYVKIDSRISVIHKENAGVSSARNVALDIIDGDYVTFVDGDDYIHPNCLCDCIKHITNYDADLVQFGCVKGNDNYYYEKHSIKESVCYLYDNRTIFETTRSNITLWGKIYKTSLWSDVRMPIGRLNEDDATTWKLYYRANKIVVIDSKFYYYRTNPDSIMASLRKCPNIEYPMAAYKERIEFFDRIEDRHLSNLSKWRYSKYLMWSMGDNRLSPDQRATLLTEFKEIYRDVLKCKSIPFLNKFLIHVTLFCPPLAYRMINIVKGS